MRRTVGVTSTNVGRRLKAPVLAPVSSLELRRDAPGSQWLTLADTAAKVGTSPSGRVTVFYDATLGAPGLKNAKDLVADADRVVTANDAIFRTTDGPVQEQLLGDALANALPNFRAALA